MYYTFHVAMLLHIQSLSVPLEGNNYMQLSISTALVWPFKY